VEPNNKSNACNRFAHKKPYPEANLNQPDKGPFEEESSPNWYANCHDKCTYTRPYQTR
jgi:hypothetical protein